MNNEDQEWIEENMSDPIVEGDGEFEGHLFLSTDGKMTVSVDAKTAEGRKEALKWAKAVYDRLMFTYGSKQKQAAQEIKKVVDEQNSFICPLDGEAYEQKQGKFGVFYSHYVGKGADGKNIYHTKKD